MLLRSDSPVQDVRARLLRTAFLNAFWPIKSMALATDIALAALDAADPAAATALVAELAGHSGAHDQLILQRARTAGVDDLDAWEQRATQLQDFTRFPYDVEGRDADSEAQRLWAGLREYLPQVAAALALYLQRLPEGWMLDLFGAPTVEQIQHSGPVGDSYRLPEVAPYEHGEDCPACGDVQDVCRVHAGFEFGLAYARALLATAAADPTARNALLTRGKELQQQAPPTGDQAAPADPAAGLLALLGGDDLAWEQLEERHHDLEARRARAHYYRAQGNEALAEKILEGTEWA
ncbi:hypothetical protein ACEZCY_35855 [Streptacidiphilus sp. N1-12]|uniref:Uncharacterized protein n=1 Tax=Streptacidiphilus alkalitolerans TaxID=3342712 RepID=A0ABV6WRB5_9ACTN